MGKDFWTFILITTLCGFALYFISPHLRDWIEDDDYESKSHLRLMDEIGRHRD